MRFIFIHNKEKDRWMFGIEQRSGIATTIMITREEMQKLARQVDIELLDSDPNWHKHLKDSLFKDEK